MPNHRILLIDDGATLRHTIREFLMARHYEVAESDTCKSAIVSFEFFRPDLVILDYSLPDGNALELLPKLKAISDVPFILLTGFGSIELAVDAVKAGAEQFLTKPVRMDALLVVIRRILEGERIKRKQMAADKRQESMLPDPFLGTSAAIRSLKNQVERVLNVDSPLLLLGETGCGKGVLASHIHMHGSRSEEPFVDINCGGLNREFLESELFGHAKGAFTGAVSEKQGLLEIAHHGTVFLDEVGDVDLLIQPKLLKVLEEKKFRRLGNVHDHKVDIRLIGATHKDLAAMAEAGTFRQDLYFRISTIPIRVPALRERSEDIPLLAELLLERISGDISRSDLTLSSKTLTALRQYSWPGNIRELRNTLERAALMSDHKELLPEDIDFHFINRPIGDPSELSLEEVERQHIEKILKKCKGEVSAAAKILCISRTTLYSKIKDFAPEVPQSA